MHTYLNDLKRRVENGAITVIDSFDGEFRWLSNFYYHDVGVTVEHLFQASKPHRSAVYTSGEGEDAFTVNWMELILQADTPGKAKRLGRKAPLRKDWDKDKLTVMYNALVDKFNVRMLGDWLVATDDVLLVEGNNWHDNYWGDCRCNREACVPLGHNHLGMLLMRVRDELRASAYLSTAEEMRLKNNCMKRESSLCDCPLCDGELTFTPEGDALMDELFMREAGDSQEDD